ncbi:MAG: tetratricopeptide repeat protein [Planctomycetota bacterium]|nr:tetratricopeptide repeat protein [Planctomycetota bacterium]
MKTTDPRTSRPRPQAPRTGGDHLAPLGRSDDEDSVRSLIPRLAQLEEATELAASLSATGATAEALAAWSRVALETESIFGTDDPAVVDAMRITASLMNRRGLHEESARILCEALERAMRIEEPDSERCRCIHAEIERAMAGRFTGSTTFD